MSAPRGSDLRCARHNDRRSCLKSEHCQWSELSLGRKRHAQHLLDLLDRRHAPLGRCSLKESVARRLPWFSRALHALSKYVFSKDKRVADPKDFGRLARSGDKWRLRSDEELEGLQEMQARDRSLALALADFHSRQGRPSFVSVKQIGGVPWEAIVASADPRGAVSRGQESSARVLGKSA